MASKWREKTLDEVAGMMGESQPGSIVHTQGMAEFARRQTAAQMASAKYILWSVVAIAITSGLSAVFMFLNWLGR